MIKSTTYSPEVRERAVRMVFEHEHEHEHDGDEHTHAHPHQVGLEEVHEHD